MGLVATNLAAMGTEQLLLALIFLASYALALGQFAEGRLRAGVIGAAVCAAIGFVALSHPWEAGVILLAGAPVGMGLFTGTAWTLWKISAGKSPPPSLFLQRRSGPQGNASLQAPCWSVCERGCASSEPTLRVRTREEAAGTPLSRVDPLFQD